MLSQTWERNLSLYFSTPYVSHLYPRPLKQTISSYSYKLGSSLSNANITLQRAVIIFVQNEIWFVVVSQYQYNHLI